MVPKSAGERLRRLLRGFVGRIALAVLVAEVAGLALWVGVGKGPAWPVFITPFIAITVLLVARSDVRQLLHRVQRGAEGEEQVGRELQPLEAEGFRLLHGIQTDRGDIDHVVVGPTGIFVIETKAWRRALHVDDQGQLRSGRWSAAGVRSQAVAAASHARRVLRAGELYVWVEALIVVIHADLYQPPLELEKARVLAPELLREYIRDGRQPLSARQVHRAANLLLRNGEPVNAAAISLDSPWADRASVSHHE